MSSNRDRYGNPMYGSAHKAERKRFAARMKAGEVFHCWRPSCLTPRVPIDPRKWDLGHVDPELRAAFGHRHPEHPQCNRRTVSHLKEKLAGAEGGARRGSRTDDVERLPDPTPDNTVTRWSRHWSGPWNPRCPECRETGEPCADARRFTAEAAR
jgi:hypothetical protein